jgi:hypothetical protein
MINENFKVYITFENGSTHTEDQPLDNLRSTIQRLTTGPAAMMGIISEVRIVDTLDCIVFHSKANRVLFPPELAKEQLRARVKAKRDKIEQEARHKV